MELREFSLTTLLFRKWNAVQIWKFSIYSIFDLTFSEGYLVFFILIPVEELEIYSQIEDLKNICLRFQILSFIQPLKAGTSVIK